jgi:SAM-dependent methyltransferase
MGNGRRRYVTGVRRASRAYDEDFFERQRDGARRSASEIVPHVARLLRPRRVIDVGCGVGTWLAVFRDHGIHDIQGVDGAYMAGRNLEFPAERFVTADLREPLRIDGRFDLALCLEVAEHLPEDCAQTLVDSLVRLAPLVLFSAAVPFQGGKLHLNEQWPDYWAERFATADYEAVDCFRDLVWHNDRVELWYAQNLLLFASRSHLEHRPELRAHIVTDPVRLRRVHPRLYLYKADARRRPVTSLLRALPIAAAHALRRSWLSRFRARQEPVYDDHRADGRDHRRD